MPYPNPFDNPTLEGFDILHTSPVVVGAFQRHHRALVCRYSDPALREVAPGCTPKPDSFILWQEVNKHTGEFVAIPGSNSTNCNALIIALLASPTPEEN
jgi:hypothetical protein